jgi:hypothetical protein
MSNNKNIKEFIAYAKICHSDLAYKLVLDENVGKDTEVFMLKLRLLRSYIKSLESYAGIKRQVFRVSCGEKEFICVQTCLNKKEICNIVNKIKSYINNC